MKVQYSVILVLTKTNKSLQNSFAKRVTLRSHCDDCAQQHSRQKLSRDHELCDDMKIYPNLPLEKNQEYVNYFIF